MTIFDFDTGPTGEYIESFSAPGYAYYRTPLRAEEGEGLQVT